MAESPFLQLPRSAWVACNALGFAIRDRYPVSPGHTLVVPHRQVATWFEATREEQHALLDLVDEVKRQLDAELSPAGYNVGFNAGRAAGQTVWHLHVHVIPRFDGDMDDPRGGVRHVIPGKGNYLATLDNGGVEVRREEEAPAGVHRARGSGRRAPQPP
jgi:diadenosine tetraphosphate (Ap4A) HIT family hydrolase